MPFRTVILVLVLGATAALAAVNWAAFTTPTTLWLGVTTVEAPVGAIMLGVVALLSALFIGWVVYLQGSVLLDARRQQRELQAQRELADKAEASRFTELRQFMSAELLRVAQAHDDTQGRILARLDQLEQRSRVAMEQASSALGAYIGELEDRLAQRAEVPPRALRPEARVDVPLEPTPAMREDRREEERLRAAVRDPARDEEPHAEAASAAPAGETRRGWPRWR